MGQKLSALLITQVEATGLQVSLTGFIHFKHPEKLEPERRGLSEAGEELKSQERGGSILGL